MGILAVCLGLVGCSSLGKKTSLPKAGPENRSGPSAARDDGPPQPPAPPAGETSGIVAGRVIDYFNNSPPSRIWIVPPGDGQGAPVYQLAETDRFGYFTINNLRPGQTYRLIAQTKDGELKQAGEVTVRPPNARVIIQVSQDRTPTLPGGGDAGSGPSLGQPIPLPPSAGSGQDPRAPVGIGQPVPLSPPGPAEGATTPIRPENFAQDPRRSTPTMTIPPQPRAPAPPKPAPPGGGPPLPEPPLAPVGATQVPSCDLRGKQLYNFALAGLDGQPWEYKRNRRPGSRLTLIDFWGTWCPPCCYTIKRHLVPLNDLYGRQGLEIIGIAYEREPTFEAQVRTVEASARKLGINYRVLMGCTPGCPVQRDFAVRGFPTLVLLDDKGQILWRLDRSPAEPEFEQLKVIIRQQLGIR
jgi:thiol-disulfide isomerase/thioredoxin